MGFRVQGLESVIFVMVCIWGLELRLDRAVDLGVNFK